MTNYDDAKIEVTGGALDTIRRCLSRIDDVRYWHGADEGNRIGASFGRSLGMVLANAEWIGYDGDLSLVARYRTGLVVGMVFHRQSATEVIKRREPKDYETSIRILGKTIDEMPDSGEWSLHS